jgi:hypothetical protein
MKVTFSMETMNIKKSAHLLVDSLPPDATWKDLLYEIYVRQEIELGLADSENGHIDHVDEVRKEFGLEA